MAASELLIPAKIKEALMRTYTQHTREQRVYLYTLPKAGHNQAKIARIIKILESTISRELRRNREQKVYRPKQVHQSAWSRRKRARCPREASTWILIKALIRQE